jgi:hypothetical protein
LGLIAQVRGLDTKGKDFIQVLKEACVIAGLHTELADLNRKPERKTSAPTAVSPMKVVAKQEPPAPIGYPPAADLHILWDTCETPAKADDEAKNYLRNRGLEPDTCPGRVIGRPLGELDGRRMGGEMGKVLADLGGRCHVTSTILPKWARWKGERLQSIGWDESGHRIVLPTFDSGGNWKSVRAIQIDPRHAPDAPKRLPPGGYTAAGLVLSTRAGVNLLRTKSKEPCEVIIVEGEPDWMTWAARAPDAVVFGIFSGAWTPMHAKAIPDGSRIVLRVHRDEAGDKYCAEVAKTFVGREIRMMRA